VPGTFDFTLKILKFLLLDIFIIRLRYNPSFFRFGFNQYSDNTQL